MKVKSLITEIRYQLSDLRKQGYPDDLLIEFINDGLCFIQSLRPEDFTKSVVYKAKCGSLQCVNDCCERLVSVDAISDCCGNTIDFIKKGNVEQAMSFDKSTPGGPARIYSMKKAGKNEFIVHPPIKPNEEVYFRVTCTGSPDAIDIDGDVPGCANHEALLRYVWYRAYAIETESATSMALSDRHYTRLMQLIGIQRDLIDDLVETEDDN